MIEYVNECVGCPTEMGCMGSACKYRNVPYFYCDECGNEEPLYEFDGEQLCIECIKNRLVEVKGDEC